MSPSVAPGAYLKVSFSLGFPLFCLGFFKHLGFFCISTGVIFAKIQILTFNCDILNGLKISDWFYVVLMGRSFQLYR